MTVLQNITQESWINFGSRLDLSALRRYEAPDRFFPNTPKTSSIKARWSTLTKRALPRVAMVHGFDTEAAIGKRPTAKIVEIEQLLIKEKIPLTESERRYLRAGVTTERELVEYIFNDALNLSSAVYTRSQLLKMEALCTGRLRITENNTNIEVDYGVPDSNRHFMDWSASDHDILADIDTIVRDAKMRGKKLNYAVTSTKILSLMQRNERIQKAINGAINLGVMVTVAQLNTLLGQRFEGLSLMTTDDWYEYSDGTPKRMFDEDTFVMYEGGANGAIGAGIWGQTVEETTQEAFTSLSNAYDGYITLTTKAEWDPPVTWLKASAICVPVIIDPDALVIIKLGNGVNTLRQLDVETTPSATAGDTKVTVNPATPPTGHEYVYKTGKKYQDVKLGADLSTWTDTLDSGDDITPTAGDTKITVAEVDANSKAVGVGKTIINI